MDNSSSSNSSETSFTQTIVITPTQLEKMGLTSQLKSVIQTHTQKKSETNPAVEAKTTNNTPEIDPKNLQKTMKNKLCTLLNHTPLVMQVKDIKWMASEKKDESSINSNNKSNTHVSGISENEEQNAKMKFKIVSDEKLNISPSEIESMLSGGKIIKSCEAISSPHTKQHIEESNVRSPVSVESESSSDSKGNENSANNLTQENSEEQKCETVSLQSTSKENTKDPGILKKECLKRIQAKMYENLRKVLDEVDSLPVKDKASLSIKPILTQIEDTKTLPTTKASITKPVIKAKEPKPCYMSTFRERKKSLDYTGKMKTAQSTSDDDVIEIDSKPESPKDLSANHSEIINIDDDHDGGGRVTKILKKKGRPPKKMIAVLTQSSDTATTNNEEEIINIDDKSNEGSSEQETPAKRGRPPKKLIIQRLSESKIESAVNEEKTDEGDEKKVVRKRGRPRKYSINTPVKENIEVEQLETSLAESETPPKRKRGRPRKIRDSESMKTASEQSNHELDMSEIKSDGEDGTKSSVDKPEPSPPRTRTRPRKIRNSESAQNTSEITDSSICRSELNDEGSQLNSSMQPKLESDEVQVKIPKKRGRKSKAELAALGKETVTKVEVKTKKQEYTKSKTSGRKRKVVDYSVLNGDDSDVDEPVYSYKRVKSYGLNDKSGKHSDDEYGSSNKTDKRVSDTEDKDTPIDKRIKTSNDESTSEISIEGSNDEIHPEDEKSKLHIPDEEETELKHDQIQCAVCKKVIEKDSWSEHKRKIHNDLAWISGEKPLNMEDTTVVEEILNAVLKEDGILKCDICGKEIDSVENYVQHKKDCKILLTETSIESNKNSDRKNKIKKERKSTTDAAKLLTSLFSNIDNKSSREDDQSELNEENNSIPQGDPVELAEDQTQCAICLKVIQKCQWHHHKQRMHNNLAWRVGDTPLDLNDHYLVFGILKELYIKKKPLFCEICGSSRKSVMGFLSHKSQCQKSVNEIDVMKVTCHLCQRTMLPVSISRHMVLSHSNDIAVFPEDVESQDDTRASSGKRKAANKAAELIQSFKEYESDKINKIVKGVRFRSVDEIITKFSEDIQNYNEATCVFENCYYTAGEAEDLFQHLENCPERCYDGYTCNFCLATFKFKRAINEHLLTLHPNETKEDVIIKDVCPDGEFHNENDSDADEKDESMCDELGHKEPKLSIIKIETKFLANTRRKLINSCYQYSYKWTMNFYKENCSVKNIFPDILPNKNSWKQLEASKISGYLPKLKRSINIARVKVDHVSNPSSSDYEWITYKLFQSDIETDGTTAIFCGGPVSAISWVPTPYDLDNADQILAVSVLPDPDKKYYSTHKYRDKELIQFWNYGSLNNRIIPTDKPKLEFCIAHDYGLIWGMEWCPSGCYDSDEVNGLKRLGLLAVACSDSFVYIYTIFKPQQLIGKIFQVQPTFKLILETVNDMNLGENIYHATKISWSKALGHSYIAVGYSNGMVGMFDLNTKSKLLKEVVDGVIALKPTQRFKPHNDALTALALYHLNNGNRWLITGSLDRECKLWDLKNISEPVTSMKRFIVTDVVWIMHWLCAAYTFDHTSLVGSVPSAFIPARSFNGPLSTFLPSNSRLTSISCCDWGNVFIQANDSGEVICGFPDQLLDAFDNDKRKVVRRYRTIASYTGYVMKNLTSEERQERENQKLEKLKSQKDWNNSNSVICSESRTYSEINDSYGLVLYDLNMNLKKKDPSQDLDMLIQSLPLHSLPKPDMYPIQSINKVVLNPNRNSFLHYACGYQVGLVRTSLLNFLNN